MAEHWWHRLMTSGMTVQELIAWDNDWHVPGIAQHRPAQPIGSKVDMFRANMDLEVFFRWGMKRDIVPPRDPLMVDGPILNLGAGKSEIDWPGEWAGRVANIDWPEWNADMDGLVMYDDSSVDGIFAFHFLEHLEEPIAFLMECQRVLRPGAPMSIVVPYYNAQIMAHDLTHKHAFCEDTWKVLFNNPYYDSPEQGSHKWEFTIGTNVIMGIVERNLSLFTQLVRN